MILSFLDLVNLSNILSLLMMSLKSNSSLLQLWRVWDYIISSLIGILHGPLSGLLDCTVGINFPEVGDFLFQGVVKVRCGKQGLDGEEHGSYLEGGAPLVLQDVQADSSY